MNVIESPLIFVLLSIFLLGVCSVKVPGFRVRDKGYGYVFMAMVRVRVRVL